MRRLRHDASGTVASDLLMNGMMMFVMLLLVIVPFIADPKDEQNLDPPAQGNMLVELFWPDDMDTDVDLWVQAPGDVPVGYSNKGGEIFNLLRDDLGGCTFDFEAGKVRNCGSTARDTSGRNMETSFSRGIPDGEYTVNVHLYGLKQGTLPVIVRVTVSLKVEDDDSAVEILATTVRLTFPKQELTALRFTIVKGTLILDSVHSLYKPLYNQNVNQSVPQPRSGW